MAAAAGASLPSQLLELLAGVAPDVDPATVRHDVAFRDQFDFDSMDLLNFVTAIHDRFGIDVPERDYRRLAALDSCVAYLRERMPSPGEPA
jgi:acyl carrier protein